MRAHRPFTLAAALAVAASTLAGCGSTGPTPAPNASAVASTAPSASTAPDFQAPGTDVVELGSLPTGAALTADGRYLWTVSAGIDANDVRILDATTRQVCQVIPLAGASGGIALDSAHGLAFVSGITVSRWRPSDDTLPGVKGNVVLVYRFGATCGDAVLDRVIAVPPPADAPVVQAYPPIPQRSNQPGGTNAWPQQLAVSPDGSRLLVPLNLADRIAVIRLDSSDQVTYLTTAPGAYAYAGAILPDGKTGLVTNEGLGTVSVIDLGVDGNAPAISADIVVGAPLSHPEGIAIDSAGRRAYVALTNSDDVAVVDIAARAVERTINVGRPAGLGTQPVALALDPAAARLYVAESGANELAVVHLPADGTTSPDDWQVVGHIPTAELPAAVVVRSVQGGPQAEIAWVSAAGVPAGPNPAGPVTTSPNDPIFWAFNRIAPTTDVFAGTQYLPTMIRGTAGFLEVPSDEVLATLSRQADAPLDTASIPAAPANTPLRADGPIKHVFFIVRENRSYDQILGDLPIGNGDPSLSVFPQRVTPNIHALVQRFGVLDNVLANSEASVQGHMWTAAGIVPDYVTRNWVQQYAGRGRPNDFGMYAVSWPGNGFLFNQAQRQGISYFNYGEANDGGLPDVADRNRTAEGLAELKLVTANSDLGEEMTPGGCYPADVGIGMTPGGTVTFDSTLPEGAPAGAVSRVACFTERFNSQLATDSVPTFNYLTLTGDHTRGTEPGFPTPTSMVADNDLAVGQIVELISHSAIWSSSAIFVVEDDSQDGADHVDAHRIPVMVISPYAKPGVVSTKYDLLSFIRSMELIIGMEPFTINDTLATPLYDAFSPTPVNLEPVDAIVPDVNLLEMNTPASPWAAESSSLNLGATDSVPQAALDAILWHSVHGVDSAPPPPGPNAEYEGVASGAVSGDADGD